MIDLNKKRNFYHHFLSVNSIRYYDVLFIVFVSVIANKITQKSINYYLENLCSKDSVIIIYSMFFLISIMLIKLNLETQVKKASFQSKDSEVKKLLLEINDFRSKKRSIDLSFDNIFLELISFENNSRLHFYLLSAVLSFIIFSLVIIL